MAGILANAGAESKKNLDDNSLEKYELLEAELWRVEMRLKLPMRKDRACSFSDPLPRAEPTEGCRQDLEERKQQLETRLQSILDRVKMKFKSELGGENLKEYNRVERELFFVEQRLKFAKNDNCLFSDPLEKKKDPEDPLPKSTLMKRSLPNPMRKRM